MHRHDHEARGAAVQAVRWYELVLPGGHSRPHERGLPNVPGARRGGEEVGLVDDDHVGIAIDDVERSGDFGLRKRCQVQPHVLPLDRTRVLANGIAEAIDDLARREAAPNFLGPLRERTDQLGLDGVPPRRIRQPKSDRVDPGTRGQRLRARHADHAKPSPTTHEKLKRSFASHLYLSIVCNAVTDAARGGPTDYLQESPVDDIIQFFLTGPGQTVLPLFQGSFNLAYPSNEGFPEGIGQVAGLGA